jgi:hypothetical protein
MASTHLGFTPGTPKSHKRLKHVPASSTPGAAPINSAFLAVALGRPAVEQALVRAAVTHADRQQSYIAATAHVKAQRLDDNSAAAYLIEVGESWDIRWMELLGAQSPQAGGPAGAGGPAHLLSVQPQKLVSATTIESNQVCR